MWAHILCTLAGLWLMAAPAVLRYGGAAETNDRVVGPLIASFAAVAVWEVTRGLRWVNVALGAWMALAPTALHYDRTTATANALIVGLAVLALSLIRGRIARATGGGWAALSRPSPAAPAALRP